MKRSYTALREQAFIRNHTLSLSRMGKVPVRLKEVVYTVSPFEVTVMSGLFKDMPKKFAEKVKHVSSPALLWAYCLCSHELGFINFPSGLQTS